MGVTAASRAQTPPGVGGGHYVWASIYEYSFEMLCYVDFRYWILSLDAYLTS